MKIEAINLFGDDAELDHVGVAVECIDSVLQGADKVTDSTQDVVVSFIQVHGLKIELVQPNSTKSPVSSMLKMGCRIVHICYSVPDIGAAIQMARKNGVHLIAHPVPAAAFENRKIAWLYSKQLGLFELVETQIS